MFEMAGEGLARFGRLHHEQSERTQDEPAAELPEKLDLMMLRMMRSQ
ncbi:hypothetical protein QP164_13925 [Sphingomonas sp. LR59]